MARRSGLRNVPFSTITNYFLVILIYSLVVIGYLYLVVFKSNELIKKVRLLNTYYNGEAEALPKFSYVLEEPLVNSSDEGISIMKSIVELNEEQTIYNLDLYGPVTESTNVIVIQVHTRFNYLKVLADSFSQMKGIENALLIFSHDVFNWSINEEIQGIKFARVMQIFFPHSLQLHHNQFHDPDSFDQGDDRSLQGSQIKLHWWWKANFVFDQVKVLKNYPGVISFTEEDTYFTQNALWMLDLMKKTLIENRCEGCQLLSLADKLELGAVDFAKIQLRKFSINPDYSTGVVTNKIPNYHLAFNRTMWEQVKRCGSMFCKYNDYNWDWTFTVLSVNTSCMKDPAKTLALRWPRVFHTGDCGYHRASKNCDPRTYLSLVVENSKPYSSIFPASLSNLKRNIFSRQDLTPNRSFGGWTNPKIIDWCLSMVQNGTARR